MQATTSEGAAAHRQAIVDAITAGPELVGIGSSDRRWLRHADGTLEEMHLGTVPQETSLWWLAHLLQVPLPCTVAVHITVGDRTRTRSTQRRRWAPLRAAVSYKERRGQLVGSEEEDALDEARELDRELRSTVAATVYDVSTYVSFRELHGDEVAFGERMCHGQRGRRSLMLPRTAASASASSRRSSRTLSAATSAPARRWLRRGRHGCRPRVPRPGRTGVTAGGPAGERASRRARSSWRHVRAADKRDR